MVKPARHKTPQQVPHTTLPSAQTAAAADAGPLALSLLTCREHAEYYADVVESAVDLRYHPPSIYLSIRMLNSQTLVRSTRSRMSVSRISC